MCRITYQLEQKDEFLVHPPLSPLPSLPYPLLGSSEFEKVSSSPSPPSVSRISPVILLIIIILSVIFFISGLLHLLVRFLTKRPSFSAISQSNRHPETSSGSQTLQRQLQQLFRLHDSGLDQALIDALPVFCHKDIIMVSKEPFDCAVCLCEFSDQDMLRLLPMCSHAFHINCIDTWLLSNSTCPLCRGTLSTTTFDLPTDNPPLSSLGEPREQFNGISRNREDAYEFSRDQKPAIMQENVGETRRVLLVRLGKLRSLNEVGDIEETSSCKLDARRCYSMGSFQYVVGDSNLHVDWPRVNGSNGDIVKITKVRSDNVNCSVNGDVEGKKISGRTKGESFSVSKIWLWSKKGKLPNSSDTHVGASSLNCMNDDL